VRRLQGEAVQIVVRAGVVEVQRPSMGSPSLIHANANSRVMVDQGYRVEQLSSAAVGREISWREGMLAFEDQSLGQAAREFGRYSDRPIEFADPTIARERITGLFATNDPQGFARSAALSLGLRVEPKGQGVMLKR
jgi:transmembrane sensor